MAEAGLESDTRKDANLRAKNDVLHDGATVVVPYFVPSGAIPEPSGAITNDPRRAELLELLSKLTDREVNDLFAIAEKMQLQSASEDPRPST